MKSSPTKLDFGNTDVALTPDILLTIFKAGLTEAGQHSFDELNAASSAVSESWDALKAAYIAKNEFKFDAHAEFSDWAAAFATSIMKRGDSWETDVGNDIPTESYAWIRALKRHKVAQDAWQNFL